jgi:hypothetical protein
MNGRSRRGLPSWTARATSSLPVPVSPWISTVLSVGLTCAICSRTCSRRGEPPMSDERPGRPLLDQQPDVACDLPCASILPAQRYVRADAGKQFLVSKGLVT